MPSVSEPQRELFAIAEHHPEKLHAENRGLAKLPRKTLHEFASTKGLPRKPKRWLPISCRRHWVHVRVNKFVPRRINNAN